MCFSTDQGAGTIYVCTASLDVGVWAVGRAGVDTRHADEGETCGLIWRGVRGWVGGLGGGEEDWLLVSFV